MDGLQIEMFSSELRDRFEKFHADNPHVYKLVKRFTFQAIERGFQHYSIQSIFERIRWHADIETDDPEFKLNNNHRPYYARLFMEDFPKHEDFFRTREVRAN